MKPYPSPVTPRKINYATLSKKYQLRRGGGGVVGDGKPDDYCFIYKFNANIK